MGKKIKGQQGIGRGWREALHYPVISSAKIRLESKWTPFAESLASTSFVRNPPPSHTTREDISMSTCEGERSLSLTTEAITGFQIPPCENCWWMAATDACFRTAL